MVGPLLGRRIIGFSLFLSFASVLVPFLVLLIILYSFLVGLCFDTLPPPLKSINLWVLAQGGDSVFRDVFQTHSDDGILKSFNILE